MTKEFIRESAKKKAKNAFSKLKALNALTVDLWDINTEEPVKKRSTSKLNEDNIEQVLSMEDKPNIVCYRR